MPVIGRVALPAGHRGWRGSVEVEGRPPYLGVGGISALDGALRAPEKLGDLAPADDITRGLNLPKSTVQRTLTTLRAAGWLRQDARSRRALTLRCATIGRSVVREHDVRPVAQPIADELRDRTHLDVGGVAAVARLHHDVLVGIGISYPLHCITQPDVTTYGRMARDAIDRIATRVTPLLQPVPH